MLGSTNLKETDKIRALDANHPTVDIYQTLHKIQRSYSDRSTSSEWSMSCRHRPLLQVAQNGFVIGRMWSQLLFTPPLGVHYFHLQRPVYVFFSRLRPTSKIEIPEMGWTRANELVLEHDGRDRAHFTWGRPAKENNYKPIDHSSHIN
jgi:hypothetical protein